MLKRPQSFFLNGRLVRRLFQLGDIRPLNEFFQRPMSFEPFFADASAHLLDEFGFHRKKFLVVLESDEKEGSKHHRP